ncbi:elongation factor 4 [Candidatus Peregrinibacteria bacterium]|nr:elongation factor 4 [Candidatus Peregrinibacteria bacterium]
MSQLQKIRNFCIIAHIDHGKSTLADRFLEITGTIDKRDMKHAQMLDTMDLEQERGITIKLQPVRMEWNGYILNLIDTPGHVDFSYEVSRSLAACEGAILVVDATQGIEAQTLANCYLALEHNLEIIAVLNKIDLPNADVERRAKEIEAVFGIPKEEILPISAKNGTNVDTLLQKIVEKFSPPRRISIEKSSIHESFSDRSSGKEIFNDETKALIFDSVYDTYKGVVAYVRVMQGSVERGDKVTFLSVQHSIEVLEVGYFKPHYLPSDRLYPGEVGYIVTGLKEVSEARVGDTIWKSGSEMKIEPSKAIPLPGYQQVKPFVFASIFCVDGDDYPLLRDALQKLRLNDAALSFEPESAGALGHGFRCGFLGLLHMEIVQERLEREYNLSLVITAPSVSYQVILTGETEVLTLSNPSLLPNPSKIEETREPWVKVEILTPKEYVGGIIKLVQEKRGISKNMQYLDENRMIMEFELPLASIVLDFYDKLKTISSGYASMNYEFLDYRASDLVKMDILIAGELVDSLSIIIHRDEAYRAGSSITKKLKELIPKAMFEIAIQAAIGSKIIARESISAMRKDVTAKLYGGDRTRKDKLLKKQKAGKKRMKMVGRIELPQEVFLAVLKR